MREVACHATERRTGGNTTDEFNSHTAYAVNLQNSVAYPQQQLLRTGLVECTLITFLSLSYRSLVALFLLFCLTSKLACLIYFLVYILENSKSIYI